MSKGHHTIIFVPHARARLRKWRVSDLQIVLAGSLLLVLTLASIAVTAAYFTVTVDRGEIVRLERENDDLRDVNESFEASIRDIQGMLAQYEERTLQLAIIAGLDDSTYGGDAGIGGEPQAPLAYTGGYGLEAVERRLGSLDGTLGEIEERLEERSRWIAATPAIAPARGILTSGYGMRRDPLTGARAFHQGVDIAAAPGQAVRATADGLVVRAGNLGGLGRAVVIVHGFGTTTRYGHLARLTVTPGQELRRGDVIGYVGNTGRSTGYHLHYEVHVDGRPVDPASYLLEDPAG
jgi:murein DD-endopeptidase MepM/ murein hydrolase activator NlpD